MKESNSYVYQHRRLDTFEIFYVGIGIRDRAYSKYCRNKHWHNIVDKCNYQVEIIQENISWEDACELEIFLISLYGRKDKGTGCLVNMTDGGEGTLGRVDSKETLEKRTGKNHYQYGIKRTEETKRILSLKNKRGCHPKAKLVLNTQTGIFYDCAKDAADSINISYKIIQGFLSGYRKNKTNLIYC